MGPDYQGPLRTAIAGNFRMSAALLTWSLTLAKTFLSLAMGIAVLRILQGPSAQDRVTGLDTLYVNAMLLLLTFGIASGNTLYFEAALLQHHVPVQLFLYAHGGHAFGIHNTTAQVQWIDDCISWIKEMRWKEK